MAVIKNGRKMLSKDDQSLRHADKILPTGLSIHWLAQPPSYFYRPMIFLDISGDNGGSIKKKLGIIMHGIGRVANAFIDVLKANGYAEDKTVDDLAMCIKMEIRRKAKQHKFNVHDIKDWDNQSYEIKR